jgi:hypothetical protein
LSTLDVARVLSSKRPCAEAEAERRERERAAAAEAWSQLEATLRAQITEYEVLRSEAARDDDVDGGDKPSGSGGVGSGGGGGGGGSGGGGGGGGGGVEMDRLRLEVEQLTMALSDKEAKLVSFTSQKQSTALPSLVTAATPEMEAARAESADLRGELERRDAELQSRAQREATLAAAEAALRSRVGELTTELQTAGGSLRTSTRPALNFLLILLLLLLLCASVRAFTLNVSHT